MGAQTFELVLEGTLLDPALHGRADASQEGALADGCHGCRSHLVPSVEKMWSGLRRQKFEHGERGPHKGTPARGWEVCGGYGGHGLRDSRNERVDGGRFLLGKLRFELDLAGECRGAMGIVMPAGALRPDGRPDRLG
jgi:hypothetical protein